MINPATGAFITEFGPLASAEVILLDEINRIPLKSQSAFLEGLQDRKITVGKTTYDLPTFSFAIATMNPVELGQGTFPLSEAATDRFAIMVNIGYLPPDEEQKLVNFDFKQVRLNTLMSKERIVQLRGVITREVFLHEKLGKYIRRLVGATRPYNAETDWRFRSPSEMVEQHVDLGASPRATICWGRLVKVWAVLVRQRATKCIPRTCRISRSTCSATASGWARTPPATAITSEQVIEDIVDEGADSMNDRSPAELVDFAEITEIELRVLRADEGVHARRSRQRVSRYRRRLRRTARLAGRRSAVVDRLAAVDAHQLQSAGGPRIRAARHRADRRRRRSVAVDAMRHRRARRSPPASRGRWRPSGCRRCTSRTCSASSRSTRASRSMAAIRPRVGRGHVIHCLDAYQGRVGMEEVKPGSGSRRPSAGICGGRRCCR